MMTKHLEVYKIYQPPHWKPLLKPERPPSPKSVSPQSKPLITGASFDANALLFPARSDYLIRNKGNGREERIYANCLNNKKYVIICTACLPLDNVHSSKLSRFLLEVVPDLLADGRHDFEVVFVARIKDASDYYRSRDAVQDTFSGLFSTFPMSVLAVPILDYGRANNLFRAMGLTDYPSPASIVVDLDEKQVSYSNITTFRSFGANFYPFTHERVKELYQERDEILRSGVSLATLLRPHSSDVVLGCVHHGGSSCCGKQQSLSSLTDKVVGLYVLDDGHSMDKVCDLYKLCKDKNLPFEVVLVCTKRGSLKILSWEAHVPSLPQNLGCCGWLQLPFKDSVRCRLNVLCGHRGGDKLVIVGPDGSYLDPDGIEVFHEYGVDGYPFTKAVWDNHVARVRGLRLQELFTTVGILDLICPDGKNVSVSSIRDIDVFMYFCEIPCDMAKYLKWFYEMKESAGETRLELIVVCLASDTEDYECSCSNHCRPETPWLSVTYEKSEALFNLLFDELGQNRDGLVAFGSDGRVRSLALQDTLYDQSGPVTFPKSDDNLRMEIAQLLKYNPFDHWAENFKF